MARPSLALVVPCYRPGANWHKVFHDNVDALQRRLPEVELIPVLVVDGLSPDIGPDQFKLLGKAFPEIRFHWFSHNYGKGFALRHGVRHVDADYYLYTDVDFPFEHESMVSLVHRLIRPDGPDVVAGVKGPEHYRKVPLQRRLVSILLRVGIRLLFGLPHSDTQTGLKGFNRKARTVFLQTRIPRYLFDLEFLLRAHRTPGIRIEWHEVALRPDVTFTPLDRRILSSELRNLVWLWKQSVKEFDR